MRTDFDPQGQHPYAFYRLLTSVVVPRPIAWVSSLSQEGVANLAPHSFFTVSCVSPPIVQFTSVGRKDSLNNVEATGEFVVNLATESMFERINASGTNFPSHVSEFEATGVTQEPSLKVGPPRVAESPAVLECKLHATTSFGDSTVIFGRVVHAAVDSDAITDELPDVRILRPLARLGRDEWSTIGEISEITRIPFDQWPGHFDGARSD